MSEGNKLPEFCYAFSISHEPGYRIVMVKRGKEGYHHTDLDHPSLSEDEARRRVRSLNRQLGVTPLQAECMDNGSMFGWEVPAANPNYLRQHHPETVAAMEREDAA
jgi:hypothetical protein